MKKDFSTTILLLTISTIFNFYSDWSFIMNTEILTFLWLFFYSVVVPIILTRLAYKHSKNVKDFIKKNFGMSIFYFGSVFLSFIDYFDFKNFTLLGDGASVYVSKIIFALCILSMLISFGYYFYKKALSDI